MSCDGRIENEWLSFRPSVMAEADWQALPSDAFGEVPDDVRDEALALLAMESARRLSPAEMKRFAPKDLIAPTADGGVLMRAVRTPANTGSYQLLTHDRAATVRYSVLSHSTATVKSAVVVAEAAIPKTVYVEISIAK